VLQALAPSLPSTEEVSARALGCLVEQGDQPAWQTLQARSTDPALPEQARVWAAAEITRLGGRLGPLTLRSLAEGRGPASDLAAVLLTTPADAKPSERLQASVTSPFESGEQRLLGIQAILASSDATQAALLSPLLAPISPAVPRQEAASALLHLTSLPPQELAKQSLAWAQRSVDSPVLMVQLAGITTLGHLPGPEPLLLLAKQRHDSTELARRAVARALAHRPEQAALTLLLTLLDDSSASVREDALVTLGKLVERRTPASAPVPATLLPRLVTLATSGPPNEQLLAASALAKLGNPYHQTQLNSFQTHQSPQLRALLLQTAAERCRAPGVVSRPTPCSKFDCWRPSDWRYSATCARCQSSRPRWSTAAKMPTASSSPRCCIDWESRPWHRPRRQQRKRRWPVASLSSVALPPCRRCGACLQTSHYHCWCESPKTQCRWCASWWPRLLPRCPLEVLARLLYRCCVS
jgi:HEAT repeat protein